MFYTNTPLVKKNKPCVSCYMSNKNRVGR